MDDDELRALLHLQAAQIAALTAALGSMRPTAPSITVRQLYDRYEAVMRGRKSWRAIRNRLRAFVALYGDVAVMSLTVPRWVEFRARRAADDPVTGKAIGTLTTNFELDWVKAMLNWASDDEQQLIPSNPLARARREKTNGGRDTWLTEDDVARLLARCSPILRAFVLIAVDTGLRISEVVSMRRDRLRWGETAAGERVAIVEFSKRVTKGKRAHLVALTVRATEAIAELPATVNPYVLPSHRLPGRPYCAGWIRKIFRAACEGAGIDVRAAEGDIRIRCHDLRHTAATAATRRGASLLQVQRMLNHSTPAITARYVHHDDGDAVALAALMQAGAERERKPPKRAETPIDAASTKRHGG